MTDNLPVLAHHSNGDSETDRISSVVERFIGGQGGACQSCQRFVVGLLF